MLHHATLKAVRLYVSLKPHVSLAYQTATHTVMVATLLRRTQADNQLVTCKYARYVMRTPPDLCPKEEYLYN